MTILKRVSAAAAAAALCFTLATPVVAANDNTVGQFVQRLAASKGLASTDARVAVDALRGVGIRLPGDLRHSKRLTEGDVAVIARAAGLNVNSSNPDSAFSQGAVDTFFVNFADRLGGSDGIAGSGDNPGQGSGPGNGNGGPPFDPFTKGKHGKGKGKGHVSPTEPE